MNSVDDGECYCSRMSGWPGGRRSTAMTRHAGMVLLCVAGLVATLSAQGSPPRPVRPPSGCGTQSSQQVVSGVAMATWVARVERDGARVLQMLVLWRGSPGWFASGSDNTSSGGGDCRLYHSGISRGDLQLQVEFDAQT